MNVYDNCYLKMGDRAKVYKNPDPTEEPIGYLPRGFITHSLYSTTTEKGPEPSKTMFRIAFKEDYGWVYGGDVHKISIYGFDVLTNYVTLEKRLQEIEVLLKRIERQKQELSDKISSLNKSK